jgi:UDP-N-acetylmuramate dehydrogenase
MTIEEHIPLGPLTTFRLGGPARYFARVAAPEDLAAAFAFARKKKLQTAVLGGGSNVLVADEGFDGLVLKIVLSGVERLPYAAGGGELYLAAAGESWDGFAARAAADGAWGIENLSGIPGTVGGAVVQNIGAYGAALSQCAAWVEAYDVQEGAITRLEAAACEFGYRQSVFKRAAGRYVVVRAAFALHSAGAPDLSYADLAPLRGTAPSAPEVRAAVGPSGPANSPTWRTRARRAPFFLIR